MVKHLALGPSLTLAICMSDSVPSCIRAPPLLHCQAHHHNQKTKAWEEGANFRIQTQNRSYLDDDGEASGLGELEGAGDSLPLGAPQRAPHEVEVVRHPNHLM
jgi:hypothetical protein